MTFSIPNFAKAKILVVGDLMLDRYWHGATDRISPEAPVPIVHIQERHERPGGAGNVALNLRALGSEVSLLGMIGDDSAGKALEEGLDAAGIICALERISGLPTISKLRVLGRHQQLIRLDSEQGFHQVDPTKLLSNCHEHLAGVNAVILSDYGKGTLQHVQSIIQLANQRQIPVLVDPKGRDFSRYYDATIITPNLKEFEAVVGPSSTDNAIAQNALALIKEYHFGAMLITRGEHGMSLIQPGQEPLHVPARVQEVYDVTGAGDTVIATLAAALAAGASLADAVLLANTAAGIAVTKMGSATVTVPELRRVLQRLHNTELGILTEDELIVTVADARAHQETIVMTNGCFDILHIGHITYLQQAKSLGTRLIMAVNDDASVKRLKGPSRPVNSLENRMAMLASLRVVDWVVPFSEDTPERLITRVLPDILVKGGDYKPHEIAGSTAVIANGGTVQILPFVEGHSTTRLIQKLQVEEFA